MLVLRGLLHSFWGTSNNRTDCKITIAIHFLVVAGLTAFFLTTPTGSQALQMSLNDPDNYQRLVQVRDWLGGQSWWDTRQYRVNPPEGLQMHWSRLADVPLAGLILLFRLFTDVATAEMLAVVSLPLVLLSITLVFLGLAARHIGGVPAVRFVQLFAVATPFFLAQFIPGRIDHHGLQLLLLAGALAAATARPTFINGMFLALATALSLTIGLEMAPLLLVLAACVTFAWSMWGESREAHLRGLLVGLLLFCPSLYALSVSPDAWGRRTYDEIGIGHIVTISVTAVTLVIAVLIDIRSLRSRFLSLGLAAIAAMLAAMLFPGMLAAPYSAIDTTLAALWIDRIAEAQSALVIAADKPARLLTNYLFPALVLLAGMKVYFTARKSANLLTVLLVGATGLLLCLWQIRALSAASLVALLLGAVVLAQLREQRERPFGAVLFYAGAMALNGLFGAVLYHSLFPAEGQRISAMDAERAIGRCERFLRGDEFNEISAGLALNGIDSGSIILARTHHSVLAAGNHRAIGGNTAAYRIFLKPAAEARQEILSREIDYVLTCRDRELQRLANHSPDSFAADLFHSRYPDWLKPLPHGGGSKVLFFAIPHAESVNETPRNGSPSN